MSEYNARDVLKKFLKQHNETLVHAVEIMNANHPEDKTTAPNLTNKLSRNTIRFSEVMEIADVLGYEIVFQEKGAPQEKPKQDHPKEPVAQKPKDSAMKSDSELADRINTKFVITSGNYFKEILIVGENSKDAAIEFNVAIGTKPTKSLSQQIGFEIMLCKQLEDDYNVTIYPCDNVPDEEETD